MKNSWSRILLLAILFMAILAPFAGLAPLMLIIIGLGLFWLLGSIAQILIGGEGRPSGEKAE